MIKIKYELITSLANDYKVYLAEFVSNYVPTEGSIVNIDGSPFIVYKVGAAMDNIAPDQTFIYVGVFKAGTFELEIGGVKY